MNKIKKIEACNGISWNNSKINKSRQKMNKIKKIEACDGISWKYGTKLPGFLEIEAQNKFDKYINLKIEQGTKGIKYFQNKKVAYKIGNKIRAQVFLDYCTNIEKKEKIYYEREPKLFKCLKKTMYNIFGGEEKEKEFKTIIYYKKIYKTSSSSEPEPSAPSLIENYDNVPSAPFIEDVENEQGFENEEDEQGFEIENEDEQGYTFY